MYFNPPFSCACVLTVPSALNHLNKEKKVIMKELSTWEAQGTDGV